MSYTVVSDGESETEIPEYDIVCLALDGNDKELLRRALDERVIDYKSVL